MTDLSELLERVKAATGPDRELDGHLWVLLQGGDARMHYTAPASGDFVWERGIDGFWVRSVVKFRAVSKFTASVDAALAFAERVLPGCSLKLYRHPGSVYATIYKLGGIVTLPSGRLDREIDYGPFEEERHNDNHAPLAIIAATLTALISQEPDHDHQ